MILGELEAYNDPTMSAFKAVQLWAAAEAVFEASGNSTYHDQSIERTKAMAETQLGLVDYGVAWAAGQAMTLEEAIEYALHG